MKTPTKTETSKYSFEEVKTLPMDIVGHMRLTGSVSWEVRDAVLRFQIETRAAEGKQVLTRWW